MLSSYSFYKYIYLKLAKISGTGRKFIATPKTVTIPKLNFIKEEDVIPRTMRESVDSTISKLGSK